MWSVFSSDCIVLWTGSVGSPLPGVEVRIVMSDTNNTTIVEGNQKESQVKRNYNLENEI